MYTSSVCTFRIRYRAVSSAVEILNLLNWSCLPILPLDQGLIFFNNTEETILRLIITKRLCGNITILRNHFFALVDGENHCRQIMQYCSEHHLLFFGEDLGQAFKLQIPEVFLFNLIVNAPN